VDGDGLGDLLIGAPGLEAGRAFVWLGMRPPTDTLSYPVEMSGGMESDFGWSVAGAGDVDGDGYDDAVVGAPDFSGSAGGAGAAWVCFGGGPSLLEPRVRLIGPEGGSHFGAAVD
jgi:hypothetical protein